MMQGNHEAGYTIMEMLVALVLLCILLIPAAAFITRLFISTALPERQIAIQLAEKHMESALLQQQYTPGVWEEMSGSFRFRVERQIRSAEKEMAILQIAVFRRERQLALLQHSVTLPEVL